jgi:cytochrome c biogenesis protein CcmG, thiol:disulfide interchange protein DsbE
VVAVVAALAVIAGVLAFSGVLGQTSPSASVIVVGRNPLLNQPAPDFSLQSIDGQTVSLSSLRGRPVIVNFWASWCVPCRDEFPLLVGAYEKYSADGLQIVGVIHDDGPQTASDFAKTYGATWPLVQDPNDAAWNLYNGSFVPVSYYIDRDGIVRAVSYGPPPSGYLDDEIKQIL